jgi:hypothetical protein
MKTIETQVQQDVNPYGQEAGVAADLEAMLSINQIVLRRMAGFHGNSNWTAHRTAV